MARMAFPRLPSAIYFPMLADAAANEGRHFQEYPTFPVTRQCREFNPCPDTNEQRDHVIGDPDIQRSQPQVPQPDLCLPILSVCIDMQVDCNIAKTKVVQTFTNHGSLSIPEAWYSFPLYDGAAVTAFRCEVGDEKVLESKVKPKDEAKREFRRAVEKLETAALVEEMAPDVFQTTIGNIEPRTNVRVEITYVEELQTDLSGDGIVVTIPTSVAPRYGTPPNGYATNSAVEQTSFSLDVNIASGGPIEKIVCRSGHEIIIEYGKLHRDLEVASFAALSMLGSAANSEFNPKHATVRLERDQITMDKDFVLFVFSSREGRQQTRALLAPSRGSGHSAMMVTVRPSELFTDLQESMDEFDGEILFLADRSGSMRGSKIKGLKEALLVFLKSLPVRCKFNLYSFGSHVSALWPCSKPYNDSTVNEALDHVATFQGDFGGTEVLKAMRAAVGNEPSPNASSTQVILLTDGEIWQAETAIDFVRKKTSESESRLRFFALGIGSQISHQLIQGIGFFGGGFGEAVAVDAGGAWKESVIRMLKGAVMPNSWSYSIGFGDSWTEKRLDVDDFLPNHSGGTMGQDLDQITGAINSLYVQAPRQIPWLHHFGHQTVYFLLDNAKQDLPEQVAISAFSRYGGTKAVNLAVTKATSNHNTIQHLAAKAAVRDLENHENADADSSDQARKNAERLCQMYSISSKWTSFVAVSHLQRSSGYEEVEVSQYKAPLADLDLLTRPGINASYKDGFATRNHSSYGSRSEALSFASRAVRNNPSLCLRKIGRTYNFSPSESNCFMDKLKLSNVPGSASSERNEQQRITSSRTYEGIQPAGLEAAEDCGPAGQPLGISPWTSASEYKSDAGEILFDFKSYNPSAASNPFHVLGSESSGTGPSEGPSTFPFLLDAKTPPALPDAGDVGYKIQVDGPGTRSGPVQRTGVDFTSLSGVSDFPCAIDWQEIIRCQRIDGLFRLDKSLEHRMDKHFCHGTRGTLRSWLVDRAKRPGADETTEEVEFLGLLVNTAISLAYIRWHFHSQQALWDLLVQKAERRLASLLNEGEWTRPDGLSTLADSALAHAHYGPFSQESGKGPWWENSPGGGRCGVCDSRDVTMLSSNEDYGNPVKCPFPACDVPTGKWKDFWAHVVEQEHISSSCGVATGTWNAAEGKERGPKTSEDEHNVEAEQVREAENNL